MDDLRKIADVLFPAVLLMLLASTASGAGTVPKDGVPTFEPSEIRGTKTKVIQFRRQCDEDEITVYDARYTWLPNDPRLNDIVEREVLDALSPDECAPAPPAGSPSEEATSEIEESCTLSYRSRAVVSYQCTRAWGGPRSGGSAWTLNIDPGSGDELDLDDLLTGAAAREKLARLVRSRMLADCAGSDSDVDEDEINERIKAMLESVSFGASGLYFAAGSRSSSCEVTIRYRDANPLLKPSYRAR
jgi:hypothetical protein